MVLAMVSSPVRTLAIGLVASVLACASGDDVERHGIVKLALQPGAPIDPTMPDPFVGTARIVASAQYGDCLAQRYADHPRERFDGEDGADVVHEWIDRLCSDDVDLEMPIECTVESIVQRLDGGPSQLTITYVVTGALAGHELAVGPVPNESGARCPGGAVPELHVGGPGSVRGLDAAAVELWTAQDVASTDAVVDQGAAVTIYAVRVPAP